MRHRNSIQTALLISVLTLSLSSPGFSENFIVTHTGDSGAGSLREAIQRSNNNSQPDSILFQIPISDPGYQESTGVWSIRPAEGPLPAATEWGLVIDGFSQTRYIGYDTNPFGPEIELNGQNCQDQHGLVALYGALSVYGLTINRFKIGIYLEHLTGGMISACYVGTDPTGMRAEPNTIDGICLVKASFVQIGSHDPFTTIVSGNQRNGIFIGDSSMYNTVGGCIIGLNRTESDTLKNRIGIEICRQSDRNSILANLISGNRDWGVDIYQSSENTVFANWIGTNRTSRSGLGNGQMGVLIWTGSMKNKIGSNSIAYNQSGIVIGDNTCHENQMTRNQIWANAAKGIDNGYGGNRGIAPPVLVEVSLNWIAGKASPNYVVEIFCDEGDEGASFLGADTADGSGNFHLIPTGGCFHQNVTATATDSEGNTSEFSEPVHMTGTEEKDKSIPSEFSLSQNYPNPFNPSTTIRFQVADVCRAVLKVYDLRGREMCTVADAVYPPGEHKVRFDATGLQSGLYIYRIDAGGFRIARKMAVMK
jgi:parallel beta-helix repeat protein